MEYRNTIGTTKTYTHPLHPRRVPLSDYLRQPGNNRYDPRGVFRTSDGRFTALFSPFTVTETRTTDVRTMNDNPATATPYLLTRR